MANVLTNGDFHLNRTGWTTGPTVEGVDAADFFSEANNFRYRPLADPPAAASFTGLAKIYMGRKTRVAATSWFRNLGNFQTAQGYGFALNTTQFVATGPSTWRLRFQARRIKDLTSAPLTGVEPPGEFGGGGELLARPYYYNVAANQWYDADGGGPVFGAFTVGAGIKIRILSRDVMPNGVGWDGHRFRATWVQEDVVAAPIFVYDWGGFGAGVFLESFPLPAWDWYTGSPKAATIPFDFHFDVPAAGVYYFALLGGNDGQSSPLLAGDPYGFAFQVDNIILEDITPVGFPPPPPLPPIEPIPGPGDPATPPAPSGGWTNSWKPVGFDIAGGGPNLAFYWTGGDGEAGNPSTPADLPANEIVHVWNTGGQVGTIPASAFVDDFAMGLSSLAVSAVDPDTGKRYLAANLERLSDNIVTVQSFGWPDSFIHDYVFAIEVDPNNPAAWDRNNVGYDSQPVVSSSGGLTILLAYVGADHRNVWVASITQAPRAFASWNKSGTCFQQVWENWTAPFVGSAFTDFYDDYTVPEFPFAAVGLRSMVEYDGAFFVAVEALDVPSQQIAVVEALIQAIPCPPTGLHIYRRTKNRAALGGGS